MKYTKIGLPRTPRDSVLVSVLGCPPQEEIYLAMVAKTARMDEHTHVTGKPLATLLPCGERG